MQDTGEPVTLFFEAGAHSEHKELRYLVNTAVFTKLLVTSGITLERHVGRA